MNTILENLNEEQLKPVLKTEGPVLVLAGAGSGKTRVLTSRIAYLIDEKQVSPSNILAITFTNKAAKEMQERISVMTDIDGMWVCTIHSMCVRILRMYSESVGISANFSIYSETERANIIKQAFKEFEFDDDKLLKNIKWHISNAKMLGLNPEEYAKTYDYERNIDDVKKVYERYNEQLLKNNALDFDDLLLKARQILKNNGDAREYLSGKFKYILVDEFQDTNEVQFDIIRMLAIVHGNLFVVGDDDQSIYGWRGAKIENILNFEKVYPKASVYKLEQNYRSTSKILDLANAVIKHNGKRKSKTLWTENEDGADITYFEADNETDEALYTVKTIARMVNTGAKLSDFAILMRVNALTRSYEQEFTKYGISFKVFGGFKFFERKEIKDLLAYLRIINNPFDSEAIVRIINFPKRGIGDRTVSVLQEYADRNDLSVYDAIIDADELPLTSGVKTKLKNFASLIRELIIKNEDTSVDKLVDHMIKITGMRECYSDNSEESVTKLANIDEFQNSIDEFVRLNGEVQLSDYLNQVTLSSDTDNMDESEYVTLATIHSVKGLEFKNVFICGLEQDLMPTSRAKDDKDDMEEERRLMYVAVTRAKKNLWLTRSKTRFLYGKREPTATSIFVKEVSDILDIPEPTVHKRYSGDYSYGGYSSDYEYSYDGSASGGRARYGSQSGYSYSGRGGDYSSRNSYGSYGRSDYGSRNTYGSGGGYGERSGGEEPSYTFGGAPSAPKKQEFSHSSTNTMRLAQTQVKKNGADVSKFKVGVKVSHVKFGTGVIRSLRGSEKNPIVVVEFEKVGVKELSLSLAPLTIIG